MNAQTNICNRLTTLYKLFYNEEFNFNDQDIEVKVQSMLFILAFFDISIKGLDNFDMNDGMPKIVMLHEVISKLILDNSNSDDLSENVKNKVRYIGEEVKNTTNSLDDLIKLSLIFYKAYTLIAPGYYNKTSFKCLESETEIGLKFIKKINDRIDQEKNG